MTTPTTSYPFDARPLLDPVDKATARAYVQELRRAGRAPRQSTGAIIAFAVIFVVFLAMFGTVAVGIGSAFLAVGSSMGGGFSGFAIIPLLFVIVVFAVIVFAVVRLIRGSGGERWYRLDRFAQANGMTWHPLVERPPLPGMIFDLGSERAATDIVRGARPRFVEFGNYRYTTGSDKDKTTHHWGYVAIKLSSPLPHIVLDAVSNNALFGSNLPASFDKHQRLSLEGDFDKHFALYCPAGYERDALYLFTPDIMARFIDNAAALDVEIVDDWLFLYAQREFSTLDPRVWAWLFSVVAALLDKFAQWERWRDDRLSGTDAGTAAAASALAPAGAEAAPVPGGAGAVGAADAVAPGATDALPFAAPATSLRPPAGVAPQGRRLRQSVPWGVIAVFGAVIVGFVLLQLGVFGGLVGSFFR